MNRIFQPFSRASIDTERLYGGTGLGLVITSRLVIALGGARFVDSEEGEWVKFAVSFPFADARVDAHGTSKRLKNATIYLIHTDPSVIARFNAICHRYEAKSVNFGNMHEMDAFVTTNDILDNDGSFVCLVHEGLYQPEPFQRLSAAAIPVLLTFGPQLSVKKAMGHYRFLLQVIPSVLMQSMYLRSGR
jgi:hypothetical protein